MQAAILVANSTKQKAKTFAFAGAAPTRCNSGDDSAATVSVMRENYTATERWLRVSGKGVCMCWFHVLHTCM